MNQVLMWRLWKHQIPAVGTEGPSVPAHIPAGLAGTPSAGSAGRPRSRSTSGTAGWRNWRLWSCPPSAAGCVCTPRAAWQGQTANSSKPQLLSKALHKLHTPPLHPHPTGRKIHKPFQAGPALLRRAAELFGEIVFAAVCPSTPEWVYKPTRGNESSCFPGLQQRLGHLQRVGPLLQMLEWGCGEAWLALG